LTQRTRDDAVTAAAGAAARLAARLESTDPRVIGAYCNLSKALILRNGPGDLDDAERLAREQTERLESASGRADDRLRGIALARLGSALAMRRELAEARRSLEVAVSCLRRGRRCDFAELAAALNTLASVENLDGFVEKAGFIYSQALEASERAGPRGTVHRRAILHNLSFVRRRLGDFAGARDAAERALSELDRCAPRSDPSRRWAALNLALARMAMGDTAGALALLRPLARSKGRGPGAPDDTRFSIHLACNLLDAHDTTLAGRVADAAARLGNRLLSHGDPDRIVLNAVRGRVFLQRGRLKPARKLLESAARDARRQNLHSIESAVRGELAQCVRRDRGGPAAAAMLRELLREQSGRPEHPESCRWREELCRSLAETPGRPQLERELTAFSRSLLRRLRDAAAWSPREAAAAAMEAAQPLSSLIAMALELGAAGELRDLVFEAIETRKILASWESLYERPPARRASKALARARECARQARTRLAEAAASFRDAAAPNITKKELFDLLRERDRAEEIYKKAGARGPLLDASPASVQRRLAAGSAWLSYAAFEADRGGRRMVALLVRRADPPLWFDLGELEAIERAAGRWREEIEGRPWRGRGRSLTRGIGGIGRAAGVAAEPSGQRLRELIWDPVAADLAGAKSIRVCPDEVLHAIPFDALPASGGRLGDHFEFQIETSAAQCVARSRHRRGRRLLAAGGIAFGRARKGRPALPPLPSSGPEAVRIAARWRRAGRGPATVLLGANVTKRKLLAALPRSGFFHIATHARFEDPGVRPRGVPAFISRRHTWFLQFLPMVYSFVTLANINGAVDPPSAMLSAEEIAGLDLSRCALAVLAACETGAGVVRAASGVASLRGAFHAAGAGASLTSLWSAPDRAAARLMDQFYARLLAGDSFARALWAAKRAAMDRGSPPRDWAGWVLTGGT
jgi:CHAT domain-containing protein